MVRYFNFCSPHLTDDQSVNINRLIMVCELLAGCLITFVIHMLAQLYEKKIDSPKQQDSNIDEKDNRCYKVYPDEQYSEVKIKNLMVQEKSQNSIMTKNIKTNRNEQNTFFSLSKEFYLTVEIVENRAPIFLGHFGICLASCIMYSPFILQTLMGLTYLLMMILMLCFTAWKINTGLVLVVAISYAINIGLLTSTLVGLGLANWDSYNMSCYYTQFMM